MSVFGDGEQTRAFSYIDDVAPQIAKSVEIPAARNEVFNIGAEKPYTVNELVAVVANTFGVAPNVKHLAARNEVVPAFSDHSKIRKVFGDMRFVALEDGVQKMAEWAKSAGARSGEAFAEIEVKKNMPATWLGDLAKN